MAKRTDRRPAADASREEAQRIARGIQRPGQTKDQTRLIAQGIQKGIELYKKQQSARARELDKKLKKLDRQLDAPETPDAEVQDRKVYRQHWLPWLLLLLSWAAMAVGWLLCRAS
jgi:hypothetical protein